MAGQDPGKCQKDARQVRPVLGKHGSGCGVRTVQYLLKSVSTVFPSIALILPQGLARGETLQEKGDAQYHIGHRELRSAKKRDIWLPVFAQECSDSTTMEPEPVVSEATVLATATKKL
uniref:hypothetical protein n=1 Tax=Arthrobacter sp. ERGS1:01 TaxID=1704044 RepID=UPI0006B5B432|nr:hypothetical protein [Arthrobacter sp. ERGS1:01]